MKRLILLICFVLPVCLSGQAQSLTIEYNIGHGSYQMSDMKDMLKQVEIPLDKVEITDNFPGYLTQDVRVGMEWKRHHAGVLFNYMNTAGKKGVTDYSGYSNYVVRNKGYKFGAFYRFRLADEKLWIFTFEPYLQLSSGVVLNRVKQTSEAFIELQPDQLYRNEAKLSGLNFFVEPAFGIQFGLCPHVALNLSVAYEWDALKSLHDAGNANAPSPFEADWSGYRAQAGLIFYLKLKK